jgi:hypothetical protein
MVCLISHEQPIVLQSSGTAGEVVGSCAEAATCHALEMKPQLLGLRSKHAIII